MADDCTIDGKVDAVLSVGEVAILASAGGLGKSCLTLALAVETATAAEAGREYGNACGLRVKAGGAVLVSYEDSPPAAVCCWWRTTPNLRATWQWPDKTPGSGPSPVPRPGTTAPAAC